MAQSPAAALAGLGRAEKDFEDARSRTAHDPAFRVVSLLPAGARQVDATRRLAAIGGDLSRAGESAAAIAVQLDGLRQRFGGRAIAPAELPGALQQAESTATRYAASARTVGEQLQAAHAERAAVSLDGLLPPLRDAYSQLDGQLAQADAAFARYQDVRGVISGMLGLPLP